MKIKDFLKRNTFIRKMVKTLKNKKEYLLDCKHFNKYYNDSFKDYNQSFEYKILLIVHSLEKGMCFKKLRPFGEKKIEELIEILIEYSKMKKNETVFNMGIGIIEEWLKVYDGNNFIKSNTYKRANDFIKNKWIKNDDNIKVGCLEYRINDNMFNIDYDKFLVERHSVREFQKKRILREDLEYCLKAASLSPTACNRQMIKIYYVVDELKKKELEKTIMGLSGFEKDSVNFFVITYDTCSLSFYGERNQGYLNSGLVAMNFVNAMHSKKIGSCFLQWGNTNKEEKSVKNVLEIPQNEKIAVVIGAGYYKSINKIPCSNRKKISEIYKEL